jgi:uncharacterized protein YbbK (DUF523 family)
MTKKIPIGVSSCLLGEEVRYDGGHKRDDYITLTLARIFEFKKFCPEVACGMGVPRPPVQLRQTEQGVRCVDIIDHNIDVTEKLARCAEEQHSWLQGLGGYILKSRSPSCGPEKVKVFLGEDFQRKGTGIFAQYLQQHFPLLPVIDEAGLVIKQLRENFMQRVFVMHRWHVLRQQLTPNLLKEFHNQYWLIAMDYDQHMAKMMGRMAASVNTNNMELVAAEYIQALMACLKINRISNVR